MKIIAKSILFLVVASGALSAHADDEAQSGAALNLLEMSAEKWNAPGGMTFRLEAVSSSPIYRMKKNGTCSRQANRTRWELKDELRGSLYSTVFDGECIWWKFADIDGDSQEKIIRLRAAFLDDHNKTFIEKLTNPPGAIIVQALFENLAEDYLLDYKGEDDLNGEVVHVVEGRLKKELVEQAQDSGINPIGRMPRVLLLGMAYTVRVSFYDETLLPARLEFFSKGRDRPAIRIDCGDYETGLEFPDGTLRFDEPAGTIVMSGDGAGPEGVDFVPMIRRPALPLSDSSCFEAIPGGVTPLGETVELDIGDELKEVNRGKIEVLLHDDGSFQIFTRLYTLEPPPAERGIDALRAALKELSEKTYWEPDLALTTDVVIHAPAELPIFHLQKFLQIANEEGIGFYRFHITVRDSATNAEGALPCFIVREWDESGYLDKQKSPAIYMVHFYGDQGERFVYELEMIIGPIGAGLKQTTFKSLPDLEKALDSVLRAEPRTALLFLLGGAFIGGDAPPESATSLQDLVDLLTALGQRGADLKRGR